MVVTCDVEFKNNPEAIYYAGQAVAGKVTLTADKIKQVKAVNLKINGTATTRWEDKASKNSGDNICWGQVDYINTLTCLLAPTVADEVAVIEPGIHTFTFACCIPMKCPSSFEGDHGSIRYAAQVTLEYPTEIEQTFTKSFTVLAIKDLNYDSSLLTSTVDVDISETFCFGPCKSDPLQISIQLTQSGFVPGQLIPVTMTVANGTRTNITETYLRLVMTVNFSSTHPSAKTKSISITISELQGDPVLENSKKHCNYLLPVPATPASCSSLCDLIQIAYHLEVEAKLPGLFYKNQKAHIPVTIGNVPLDRNGMVVQQQPLPRQIQFDNISQILNENFTVGKIENNIDTAANNETIVPWLASGNIPSPVYMTAAYMTTVNLPPAQDNGGENFTPKYPVFNISTTFVSQQLMNADETDGNIGSSRETDPDKSTWL